MKALVVDDDAQNRDILTRMLRKLGWDAESAGDGKAALEGCSFARYDLVLVDLLMPGIGGADVARAIREAYSSDGFRPKVIAVTGAFVPDDDASGFDEVLAKPFVMEELYSCIGRVMGSGKQPPDR
jgi:CheY-like chemotaxis protein